MNFNFDRKRVSSFVVLTMLGFLLPACFIFQAGAEPKAIDFNRDIRPILSDKCFFCHGPDSHERKADLRLDTSEGARADLGGYAAIVPGKPQDSEFVIRILDKEEPMPPEDSHKSLSQEEITLLQRWISEGGEYSDPWAYVKPAKQPVPELKANKEWPKNQIDHFVLDRLKEEGLSPSPDADRVTLIRRLYFDLIGLPPTPDQAAAFISGDASFEEVVDELLASPHFGERLAMYWLDLVRYADTVGYHGDQDHNISPYRDYVIRAFNQNLPFDQFTREQLAGDLLENPTKWQKVASGYNRLLQTSHEGGIQAKEYDAIYAADRVRNLSAVWMGATIGCAQCHDHKYDPYTIQDHYAMAAFFADIHDVGYTGNSLPTKRPPEMSFLPDEQEAEMKSLKAKLGVLAGTDIDSFKSQKDRNALAETLSKEKRQQWDQLVQQIDAINRGARLTMITAAKEPRTMRVLPRGNWQDDSGEVIKAAVPTFLGKIKTPEGTSANRLDLANWLTDPQDGAGGLTARVFANRFWFLFFGSGISPSLSDFGGQGQPPTNPALLDHLSVTFHESGWDMKGLVRLLVTSRTYRQSSLVSPELLERDPVNQLVARQSRYRLPAEVIRDNALSTSGLLVNEFGGHSVKPYQPPGYYRHLNFPVRKYQSHNDERQWRRGVYVHWQRMFLHPMMKALDAPSREECTAERPRSNTPNAALVLLNDPTFVEAARVLAQRVLTEGGESFEKRLEFAYQLTLSRPPDQQELDVFHSLLESTKAIYREQPEAAAALAKSGLAPASEKIEATELASWTAITRGLLNLNETNTRN